MPFVQAKCTNCGANLEVNSEHDAAICPYCHTPFIVEKAINNYITNNVTNIDHLHADVLNITDSSSEDNLAKSGETFLRFKEYNSAEKSFKEMTEKYPYDYRGWWGLVGVYTKGFSAEITSRNDLNRIAALVNKAKIVSSTPERLDNQFLPYYNKTLQIIIAAEQKQKLEYEEAEKRRFEEEAKRKKELADEAEAKRKRESEIENNLHIKEVGSVKKRLCQVKCVINL